MKLLCKITTLISPWVVITSGIRGKMGSGRWTLKDFFSVITTQAIDSYWIYLGVGNTWVSMFLMRNTKYWSESKKEKWFFYHPQIVSWNDKDKSAWQKAKRLRT